MSLPDPVELASRRLREAHDLLREEPSGSVRAKILQAAAQHHRPAAAEAAASLRPRSGFWSWLHWRPPVAVGATIVVGLLAIGVALQVDRVQVKTDSTAIPRSTETGPAPAAAPAPDVAQPPAAPPAAATTNDGNVSARRDAFPAASQAPSAALPWSNKVAPSGADQAPRNGSEAEVRGFVPAPPPPVRSAAAGLPRPSASVPQSGSAAVPMARPPMSKQSLLGGASAPPPLKYRGTAQEWLKRIVELRNASQDAEADEELMRFKAVYPDVTIPESAQRR